MTFRDVLCITALKLFQNIPKFLAGAAVEIAKNEDTIGRCLFGTATGPGMRDLGRFFWSFTRDNRYAEQI